MSNVPIRSGIETGRPGAARLTVIPGVSAPLLRGRTVECARLDELLDAARRGESGALVLRGEAGMGKTALLDYVAGQGEGCAVVRSVGVESEMELPFAALHQLCLSLLEGLERLPPLQRDALRTAFGLSSSARPDPFLVGLAALTLLSYAAEGQPLICLVDDAQWLDRSSAEVLSFVARRLQAESVTILFAERDEDQPSCLARLPELELQPLSDADARELLSSSRLGPLDQRVGQRIVAEARGNPLALLELPHGLSSASLAGGFAVAPSLPLMRRVEASFRRQVDQLPEETQRLLLLGAAEPLGDPILLWRAAEELGIPIEAAVPAEEADLIAVGTRVTFRHPLLRSAIYHAASPNERRNVHRALANATDLEADPDRRAWHRAHAALVPDEEVALELELSADRAQARGGIAAAAAFLQHSVVLTVDPARRAERALSAAQMKYEAGLLEDAEALLVTAELVGLDDLQQGQALVLRARIAFVMRRNTDKRPLLLSSARCVEAIDPGLARTAYMQLFHDALHVGRLDGAALFEVSAAALGCPPGEGPPRPHQLLLEGLATRVTQGYAAGAPILKQALTALDTEANLAAEDAACLASRVASDLWDEAIYARLAERELEHAQTAGALTILPRLLDTRSIAEALTGDLSAAAATIDEMRTAIEATGVATHSDGALLLGALRGYEDRAVYLIAHAIDDALKRGEGLDLATTDYAAAILNNALGRYDMAVAVARDAIERPYEIGIAGRILSELVEAASRTGDSNLARTALEKLVEMTQASGTQWALGVEARCRAVLSAEAAAEILYLEGIERLGSTDLRPELARTRLLYGEWLRREGRRADAREHLRSAHDMLTAMGMDGFAERARRELAATGEKVRKRTDETRGQLTAQEEQIARLAADGQTNQEIGAQLFLSPRTVEWHLHKVFTKLGVCSRMQLRDKLPDPARADAR
jgi:DNA-binding CsgD family transcriptional regulator